MGHALRMISNRSDVCVFSGGVGHECKTSEQCNEERERAGEKNTPLFLQNTFHLSKRWRKYVVQLRDGRV